MRWIPHYTGSDFLQTRFFFARRDSKTKRLRFFRIETPFIGVHLGWTNHLTERGIEFFTSNIHCGILARRMPFGPFCRVRWSGSGIDPLHTYTIVIGRFFIGSRTDFWLERLVQRRREKEMEKASAAYEAWINYPEEDQR